MNTLDHREDGRAGEHQLTAMNKVWEKQRLTNVTLKITDGSHNPPKGVTESDYIMLSSKNVFDDDLHYTDPRYLSAEQYQQEHKRTGVVPGDVLLTIVGTIGRSAVVPFDAPPITLQRSVAVIRPNRHYIEPRFLMYSLTERSSELNEKARGVAQKGIYLETLRELELILPPLAEQQRIVAILDEAFEGIATARKHAEQNLQNAKALFESHLEAVFSNRGEGWVEKSLETVGSILIGYSFNSSDFSCNEGTRCIKITNVGVREFVSTSDGFLPDSFSDDFAKVSVKEGSIVIALTRTIIADGLKVAVVPKEYDGALLNQRVASITVNENEVSTAFLFAYLTSQRVVDYVKAHVNTLMQPNLSIADLRSLPTPTPPRQYQDKTTVMLDALRDETNRLCDVYTQKIAALDALKKSLLHQAFSGEL